MDPKLQALLEQLIESQTRTDRTVYELAKTVTNYVDAANAAHTGLTESIAQYVAAADARMKRIEENLDGLIRAITREHTNGKPH